MGLNGARSRWEILSPPIFEETVEVQIPERIHEQTVPERIEDLIEEQFIVEDTTLNTVEITSSSSTSTSIDRLDEQLTNMLDMLGTYKGMFSPCGWSDGRHREGD